MQREEGGSIRAVLTLLASRIPVVALAGAAGLLGFNPGMAGEWNIQFPLLSGFARWDSAYYLDISKFGYPGLSTLAANPGAISLYAFRPVYPFVLWLLRPLFGWMYVDNAELLAGFLWNLLMLCLAAVYLEKLTRHLFGEKVAWRTLVLLAIFPTSYIFSAIYPESTFLLLSVACLYFAEKGKVAPAALLGFLAGLTRPEGVLIAVPLLLMGVEKHRGRYFAAATVVASSLPAFMAFAYMQTGNSLAPLMAESGWDKVQFPSIVAFVHGGVGVLAAVVINLAVLTLAAVLVVRYLGRAWRDRRLLPYFAWAAAVLLGTVFLSDVRSWARLTVLIFPVLWAQSEFSLGGRMRYMVLGAAYAAMLVISTVLFADWYPML